MQSQLLFHNAKKAIPILISEISQTLVSKDSSYPVKHAVLNPYHEEKIFACLWEAN